ncbi:MAG TPA: NEW3 domain-containing protein [Streptosporangiaceae bacterium]|nr:NEW3 domain-containing protein [Streptosporangiaceae bacterium]
MKRLTAALTAGLVAAPLAAVITVAAAPAASAESNGVGQTPAMGWSTWSFIRTDPTAAKVEAQALALKNSGLAAAGYGYINLDDFWYMCPGSQGPDVDANGRWVIDATKFPPDPATGRNGIQVVADYVHSLGLKFGLYATPGISAQAVAQNSPILGPNGQPSGYTTDQIAEPAVHENNYNCGGMVGINYASPGGQYFIDSWADEFASWGVDYLKLDGVGAFDIPDVQAWSQALVQTGRPIHLELSNNLAIGDAATWAQYSNGWRTGGDIECYGCETGGSHYPLTDWANIASRFNQVAAWQPYGGPGAFNDYDSIEVGNGANDGLTYNERQSQLSLWALASSPLILGTDLTNLTKQDLGLLLNKKVIAVDQDAIDASRISDTATSQVFAKVEKTGVAVAGLFNTGGQAEQVTTTASAIGLPASPAYLVDNLWKASHATTESAGTIVATVPAHGVALVKVTPVASPGNVPPEVSHGLSGTTPVMTAGQPVTLTESFTDDGAVTLQNVTISLTAPTGWTVTPTSPATFPSVASGQTVQTTFSVTAPAATQACTSSALRATVAYQAPGFGAGQASDSATTVINPPGSSVSPPFQTFSSATDAPPTFGQSSGKFCISGAGTDLYSSSDSYSAIYHSGAAGPNSVITTEVVSHQALVNFAKAGIIVRNTMTGSGTTPEGVILFYSPAGGIQLEWDSNGGDFINSVTPANGTLAVGTPVHLMLQRTVQSATQSTYVGYYSTDGKTWHIVGSATVPGQNATQDAGMFVVSGATGVPGGAVFHGFSVRNVTGTSYEAESTGNTVVAPAAVASCSGCSGGQKVGFVGFAGTLTFNNVNVATAGTYQVVVAFCDGDAVTGRQAEMTVNGGTPQLLSFRSSGSWTNAGFFFVNVALNAGNNTIEFSNPTAYAPDLDRLIVPPSPA